MFHKLQRLKSRLNKQQTIGLVVAVMVAGIGVYFLTSSHAASPFVSSEAESGTLGGSANIVSDTNASGGSAVKFGSSSSDGSLTVADLQLISTKRIVFGHQSVGGIIYTTGIPEVYQQYGVPLLNMYDGSKPAIFDNFGVGQNGDPMGKIADFNYQLRSGFGSNWDVAFFKFCYIDFDDTTDTQALFNQYKTTMTALQRDFPRIKFLYVTTPLTTWDNSINIVRENYNNLLRQQYGSTGRLFDLATVESTTPTGQRVTGTYQGRTYYMPYGPYVSDGAHPNNEGAKVLATAMLQSVAAALKQ